MMIKGRYEWLAQTRNEVINLDPYDDEKNGINVQLDGLDVWLVYQGERNRGGENSEEYWFSISSYIEGKQA